MDEARGRKVARLYGLKPRGTIGAIIEEYRSGRLTKKGCKELIFRLIGPGYRISEETLVYLLNEFE